MHAPSPQNPVALRRVLCIDDDTDYLSILRVALKIPGVEIVTAVSAEEGLRRLAESAIDLVLTDLNMPGGSGFDVLRAIRAMGLRVPVLVLTAQGSIEGAKEALRLGARDFLTKPIDPDRLKRSVEDVLRDPVATELGVSDARVPVGLLAVAPKMLDLLDRAQRAARTDVTVLLTGESGTGKELVARAIHLASTRAEGPFVPVHTGAIPKDLIASELFGHERGSFTGAVSAVDGKFDAAEKGTLFLDEVGTMDLAVQVTLLRVLETFRYTRVGGRRERSANVRIVAATNRDLGELVSAQTFREDLYYRLNVVTLVLPPLRERPEDIPLIAQHYLAHFAQRHRTPARRLDPAAIGRLMAWSWPGNVRELRNTMEQAALFARAEVIGADDIPLQPGAEMKSFATPPPRSSLPLFDVPVAPPAPDDDAGSPWAESTQPTFVLPLVQPSAAARTVPAPMAPLPLVPPPVPEPPMPLRAAEAPEAADPQRVALRVGMTLDEVEREMILRTLEALGGNKQRAARMLGISRRSLYNKLALYGLGGPDEPEPEGS
ncbi:MAG: sigma-54-dependent Fis family transcriptional regulator [Myxococcales bacterium]|nr:sigma-54-dependent Fis family transcriptional regulator [Myxococcales bacterium]